MLEASLGSGRPSGCVLQVLLSKMGIKAALPTYELGLYALIVSCAIAYSGQEIFESSRDSMNRKAFRENIKPGWHYFGRKMDVADFEWAMWFTSFRNLILFALSGHVLFAKICSMAAPQNGFVPGTFDLQDILFYGGTGFSIMRCMSFALENCERKEGNYSIFALMKYNFYLPFFFFGPIMIFDQFHVQAHNSQLQRKDREMWHIIVHAIVQLTAIVAVDDHDNILKELMATTSTFLITTLWLGPCEIVYIWSICNCFGLNFELWVQQFFQLKPFADKEVLSSSFMHFANMSEATSRRIRSIFGAANFWAIVFYNILALNSLEFALLVAKRIFLTGFPLSTFSIWFITYCGVQLIKERERILAIRDEEKDKEKAE
ncbi:Protein-cysteine N-palmitoyltransferase HHAT-like protein, partial [Ophiophagus hannah]